MNTFHELYLIHSSNAIDNVPYYPKNIRKHKRKFLVMSEHWLYLCIQAQTTPDTVLLVQSWGLLRPQSITLLS